MLICGVLEVMQTFCVLPVVYVRTLIVMMYASSVRCHPWESWVKGCMMSLYYVVQLHVNLQLSENKKCKREVGAWRGREREKKRSQSHTVWEDFKLSSNSSRLVPERNALAHCAKVFQIFLTQYPL